MNEWLSAILLLSGALLMLVAAVGLLRMPDLLMRMHATTKAGALGAGLIMCAVSAFYTDAGVTAEAFIVVVFIMLTAPVAAHVIGRAGYFVGVPLSPGMVCDELKGRYDEATHLLESPQEFRKDAADEPYP